MVLMLPPIGLSSQTRIARCACGPDPLNPIEQAFSKLKMALRKGAARTVTTLLKLIGRLIKTFAPQECANYFRHAGYGV
jgi:transposase